MRYTCPSALLLLLAAAGPIRAATPADTVRALQDRALADDTAYDLVHSLTSEVGPRLAGSPGDANERCKGD